MKIRFEVDHSEMLTLEDPDQHVVVLSVIEPSSPQLRRVTGELVAGFMRAWLYSWEKRVGGRP